MKCVKNLGIICLVAILTSGCTQFAVTNHFIKRTTAQDAPYQAPPVKGKRKIGKPYVIDGIRYYPMQKSEGYREKGIASWYGKEFHNRKTANGERYDMYAVSAAHKTLPLPTWVRVTNLENGRSLVLRVNDRGPFVRGRIIDLSYGAARALGTVEAGVAPVLVEALPTDGSPLRVRSEPRVTAERRVAAKTPERKGFTHRVSQQKPTPKPVTKPKPIIEKPQVVESKPMLPPEPIDAPRPVEVTQQESVSSPAMQEKAPRHPAVAPKVEEHKFASVRMYVQTGAFGNIENAERQASALRAYYDNVIRQEIERDGRTLQRVRVGPFETLEAADAALARLVEAGFNTAIIAVENR
jgi:rare lipoprotein A